MKVRGFDAASQKGFYSNNSGAGNMLKNQMDDTKPELSVIYCRHTNTAEIKICLA